MGKSFREDSDFARVESLAPSLRDMIAKYGVVDRWVFNDVRVREDEDKVVLEFPSLFQAEKAFATASRTVGAFFRKTVEWRWDETKWNRPRCLKEQDKTRQRFNPHIYYNATCDQCEPGYGCKPARAA